MPKVEKLTLAEIRTLKAEAQKEANAILREFGEGRKYLNQMAVVKHYERLHDRREWEEIQADKRAEAMEEWTPDEYARQVYQHGADLGPKPWDGLLPERGPGT